MTLKRYFIPILLFLAAARLPAQEIRISGFSRIAELEESLTEPGGSVCGSDGEPCALLVLSTREKGWTFDAGLAGIADICYAEDEIRLWVGAGTRSLTVSHPVYGVLRNWTVPVTLESGGVYRMRLGHVSPTVSAAPFGTRPSGTVTPGRPAPAPKRNGPAPAVPRRVGVPPVPGSVAQGNGSACKGYCSHFVDAYAAFLPDGGEVYDAFLGLRYTYLGGRIGPYFAAAYSLEESYSLFGGIALRLGNGGSDPDWQVYGGLGLMDGCHLAGEAGVRIGWLSEGKVSRWDFGGGCQLWEGTLMPTVEVGLCIWGIPVLVGLGLCLGAI